MADDNDGKSDGGGKKARISELLSRAKSGDKQAQNELLTLLRPYLKVVAKQSLDPRMQARQDASDLVQETLEEGLRDFKRFAGDSERELHAYFKRILQRNAIDARRAQVHARRRSVGLERSFEDKQSGIGLSERLAADATSPSQTAARSQLVGRLLIAMGQLPEGQRGALQLWQAGHSYKEIANLLHRTESAAQSLVKHALKTLREQFPQDVVEAGPRE